MLAPLLSDLLAENDLQSVHVWEHRLYTVHSLHQRVTLRPHSPQECPLHHLLLICHHLQSRCKLAGLSILCLIKDNKMGVLLSDCRIPKCLFFCCTSFSASAAFLGSTCNLLLLLLEVRSLPKLET